MIMDIFFENTVTSELIVVYGLIALVLILIVVIVILDKKEKHKKKDLFNNRFINTVKMKPVAKEKTEPVERTSQDKKVKMTAIKEKTVQKEIKQEIGLETRQIKKGNQDDISDLDDLIEERQSEILDNTLVIPKQSDAFKAIKTKEEPFDTEVRKQEIKKNIVREETTPKKTGEPKVNSDLDLSYTQIIGVKTITEDLALKTEQLRHGSVKKEEKQEKIIPNKKVVEQLEEVKEEELSKTQAQISVEALHRELEKALQNERNNIDNLEQLEEDEAIISYDQLVKVSDKIYEENDNSEYLDEDDYPITINELRKKFQQEMTEVKPKNKEISKVQLQEFVDKEEIEQLRETKVTSPVRETFFRTTPIISPVYGIQDSNIDDAELLTDSNDNLEDVNSETASELLNRLKEFSSNR